MQHETLLFSRLPGHACDIGLIELNRGKALNALNDNMIQGLQQQLSDWAQDDNIAMVIIRSTQEKAFCAGGDIRRLVDNPEDVEHFFWHEYRLNHFIHQFPKPYLALLHGITMGGGVGISIHGSHPVASLQLKFAMPETGIGFLPDIGAGYFLNRCPGQIGTYLGLTGQRINAPDALYAKLIKHIIPFEQFDSLIKTLQSTNMQPSAQQALDQVLSPFAIDAHESNLAANQTLIDKHFQYDQLEQIFDSLQQDDHPFAQQTLATLRQKSPTSLILTLRYLRESIAKPLDQVLSLDYRIVLRIFANHDFYEGVRAAIIDKDNQPQWQPDSIEQVEQHQIDSYFAPLKRGELRLKT